MNASDIPNVENETGTPIDNRLAHLNDHNFLRIPKHAVHELFEPADDEQLRAFCLQVLKRPNPNSFTLNTMCLHVEVRNCELTFVDESDLDVKANGVNWKFEAIAFSRQDNAQLRSLNELFLLGGQNAVIRISIVSKKEQRVEIGDFAISSITFHNAYSCRLWVKLPDTDEN